MCVRRGVDDSGGGEMVGVVVADSEGREGVG